MAQKSFIAMIAAFITLAIFWLIGLVWFAAHVAMIEPERQNTKTDAIIVLTGGKYRIDTGLHLLKDGRSRALFISGVNPNVTIEDLVADRPVPCCITLGYKANNTEQNAKESAEWIRTHHIHSIRLVTSNYHMARSKLAFRSILPDLTIVAHPVLPDHFEPQDKKFWPTIFAEYNKTLATWIKFSLHRTKEV